MLNYHYIQYIHRRQVWITVGDRGAGQWSSGRSCGMSRSIQTFWLQLNPKIMLIEFKYISQLHFSIFNNISMPTFQF